MQNLPFRYPATSTVLHKNLASGKVNQSDIGNIKATVLFSDIKEKSSTKPAKHKTTNPPPSFQTNFKAAMKFEPLNVEVSDISGCQKYILKPQILVLPTCCLSNVLDYKSHHSIEIHGG